MEINSENLVLSRAATEHVFKTAYDSTWWFQVKRRAALRKALAEMRNEDQQKRLIMLMPKRGIGVQYSWQEWADAILRLLEFIPGFGFIFALVKLVFDLIWGRPIDSPGQRKEFANGRNT